MRRARIAMRRQRRPCCQSEGVAVRVLRTRVMSGKGKGRRGRKSGETRVEIVGANAGVKERKRGLVRFQGRSESGERCETVMEKREGESGRGRSDQIRSGR